MTNLIENIYNELDKLDSIQEDNTILLEKIKFRSDHSYSQLVENDKSIKKLNRGLTKVSNQLIPLIQDIELHISERHIEQSLNKNIQNEYNIILDNINITMKRQSSFDILLMNSSQSKTMIVQSKWEIKNSFNGSKENYLLKFYLSFKIMNNKLDTFNIRRTTFHNSRLIRVDPFEFLPILKKPKILKEFDREFAKVEVVRILDTKIS